MSTTRDIAIKVRDLYEAPARDAKFEFAKDVWAWLAAGNITQRELGRRIGYSSVSVSEFLRRPETIPENFIRTISLTIPELAGQYVKFRLAADAEFFRASREFDDMQQVVDRFQSRADIHLALDQAAREIAEIIARVKMQV